MLEAYEPKLVFEMLITSLLQLIACKCNVHRVNNGRNFIEGSDFCLCIAIQFKLPLSNVNMYVKITKTEC